MVSIINLNHKYVLPIYICIFIATYFIDAISFNLGFAFKLFMLASLIYLSIYNTKIRLQLDNYDYIFIIFTIYMGISAITSLYVAAGLRYFFGTILIFTCYLCLKNFVLNNKIVFEKFDNYFSITAVTILSISLVLYVFSLFDLSIEFDNFIQLDLSGHVIEREIPRITGLSIDPNILGFTIFPIFFYNIFKFKQSIYNQLATILCCVVFLLTFSLAVLISLLVCLALYVIFSLVITKKPRNLIILIALLLVLLLIFAYIYNNNEFIYNVIQSRLRKFQNIGGRTILWSVGIELVQSKWLFGIGTNNFIPYTSQLYELFEHIHNSYLEVVVENGILGLVLYLIFQLSILLAICQLIKKDQSTIYLLFIFVAYFMMMNSLSIKIHQMFFFLLVLIAYEKQRIERQSK